MAAVAASGGCAFFNGALVPFEQVCISPLDRGFLFGDGVYEVLPVYGGHFLGLSAHLARLSGSLAVTRISDPYSAAAWGQHLQQLVDANGGGDCSVYLQVTRGVAPRDHAFPDVPPTVFAMVRPLSPSAPAVLDRGLGAVLLEDIRWRYCHAKTTSLIANVMLRQQAHDAGADEAILLRDGLVTEGAASNVFAVLGDEVVTPPQSEALLHGITRELVIGLCRELDLPLRQGEISERQLRDAREVWVSSSTREVMPVTRIEGAPVADGEPGPLWGRVYRAYQALKARVRTGDTP